MAALAVAPPGHPGHPLKYACFIRESARNNRPHPDFLLRFTVNVLALTILVSTSLAGIFIACFAMEVRRARRTSPERDSLLPLDPENPSKTPIQPRRP
jgi:hypothetical protein